MKSLLVLLIDDVRNRTFSLDISAVITSDSPDDEVRLLSELQTELLHLRDAPAQSQSSQDADTTRVCVELSRASAALRAMRRTASNRPLAKDFVDSSTDSDLSKHLSSFWYELNCLSKLVAARTQLVESPPQATLDDDVTQVSAFVQRLSQHASAGDVPAMCEVVVQWHSHLSQLNSSLTPLFHSVNDFVCAIQNLVMQRAQPDETPLARELSMRSVCVECCEELLQTLRRLGAPLRGIEKSLAQDQVEEALTTAVRFASGMLAQAAPQDGPGDVEEGGRANGSSSGTPQVKVNLAEALRSGGVLESVAKSRKMKDVAIGRTSLTLGADRAFGLKSPSQPDHGASKERRSRWIARWSVTPS
jgi:hypothetical protein